MECFKLKRWDKYVQMWSKEPHIYRAVLGANKYRGIGELHKDEETVCDITYAILAPTLNLFVVWVLFEALKQKKQRLYFLARDGYFMYQCASAYVEYFKLPIECKYISCSRYSLRVPMYHLDMEEALSYITLGGLDITMEKIFKRAALTEKQKCSVWKALDLPFDMDEQLSKTRLDSLRDTLRCCDSFLWAVQENSKKAFPLLEEYVRQEGLLDEVSGAIVDSGWVGSMQKQLNALLGQLKGEKILEGYYFGLYELPKGVRRSSYHSWYFTPEGEIRKKVYFSNCLFEAIFSAPYGMTLGYEKTEAGIRPKLADVSKERRQFLELTGSCLAAYQKALLEVADKGQFEEFLKTIKTKTSERIVSRLLKQFMSRPAQWEAAAYGKLEFSDDVLEYGGCLAEPMNEQELRKNHLLPRMLHSYLGAGAFRKQSAWYEGSAVLGSRNPWHHWVSYSAYKYLLYARQRKKWRRRNEHKK